MKKILIFVLFFAYISALPLWTKKDSNSKGQEDWITHIENHTRQLMEDADIPGLSLVIIKENGSVYFKCFGYADKEKKIPVTPDTLFELGSCSKAFTALAAIQMEKKGLIDLDAAVSDYFPWFSVKYRGKSYPITLRQLLHHTSGIPWNAITRIPPGSERSALEQTARNLVDIELEHVPGKAYLYSTVNYDVLGAIIELKSGTDFETYMTENIFIPLDLHHTRVGVDKTNPPTHMARGYKNGFGASRPYNAPVYRGNNPAAYVISNAKDVARWLKFQMGIAETPLYPLIRETRLPDLSVKPSPDSITSYAMGWTVNRFRDKEIAHGGLNPNFTAFMGFNPRDKTAVAVMANSNSPYTEFIGAAVMKALKGRQVSWEYTPAGDMDKPCTVMTIVLALLSLTLVLFLSVMVYGVIKGKRQYETLNRKKLAGILAVPLLFLPFLWGLYLIPKALANVDWETTIVWTPQSFQAVLVLLLLCIALGYGCLIVNTIFPGKNKYLRPLPMMVLVSLLSGGANAAIIFIITGSIYPIMDLKYLLYYFLLTLVLYIGGRKVLQTKLLKISTDIIYDLRMNLIEKIFYTSYQRFEEIEQGRIFATLNDDTSQISNSVSALIGVITNLITVITVFIYLGTIAFWGTLITILTMAAIAVLVLWLSYQSMLHFEQSRSAQETYMGLLNGLVDGFKELSLHSRQKKEYQHDLENTCETFREKLSAAFLKGVSAMITSNSILLLVLGVVAFALSQLFPQIKSPAIMSFIIALLYVMGPIYSLLGSVPQVLQLRVAWNRVQGFIKDIPANMEPGDVDKPLPVDKEAVRHLKAKGVMFAYKKPGTLTLPAGTNKNNGHDKENNPGDEHEDKEKTFVVGPLDFEAAKGEIVFIVGGNGSGKTTLAKMLTGLYILEQGSIEINDRDIPPQRLGEYFSVIFSNYHLFEKLYDVDMTRKGTEAGKYLEMLEIKDKVEIVDNKFSTLQLSGGQRKRLALLRVSLEDSPIFLFDEVAADQDPRFRKFFYRELLPRMKNEGKIIIGITHDDHYFDVADRVIKMDMGQIDYEGKGPGFVLTPGHTG